MRLLQLCTFAVTPHGCGFQSALPCLAVADIFAVNHFAAVREHAETAAMVVEAQLICEQGVQGETPLFAHCRQGRSVRTRSMAWATTHRLERAGGSV